MEKPDPVAQREEAIRRRILSRPDIFSRQGSVQASYRRYGGRVLGPYYRVLYRDGGGLRSIYIGAEEGLAEDVRRLLEELQQERREELEFERCFRTLRRRVREAKARLDRDLRRLGLYMKGFEVRGWARGRTAFKKGEAP